MGNLKFERQMIKERNSRTYNDSIEDFSCQLNLCLLVKVKLVIRLALDKFIHDF